MFNYKHYIAVLRWKAAEKEAIGGISTKEKQYITPLIELVMPQPTDLKVKENGIERVKTHEELLNESINKFTEKLNEIPKDILKYWGNNPAFIDLSLIDFSIRKKSLIKILDSSLQQKLFLIPVIRLLQDPDYLRESVMFSHKSNNGVCLRLYRSDFKENLLTSKINEFLSK